MTAAMNSAAISATFMISSLALLSAPVSVTRTNYHGWADSVWLSNGQVEAVVVPAIGRIMRLGFIGVENVIWENRALDGRVLDGQHKEWINLGGDKSWPSPEAEWGQYTGDKSWFPPRGFDGLPATATIKDGTVILTHPVDAHYGIRAVRHFTLDPVKPVLTVRTIYERVQGKPAKVGIWIITQLTEPAGVFIPVPERSVFPTGYRLLLPPAPPSLKSITGPPRLLSLTRNPEKPHKIGADASTLVWVGEKTSLRIDSPRVVGAEYPDGGSSAEVYTNPGDLKYIELEMLGPLRTLRPGDRLEQTNVYTLRRRTETDPTAEAIKLLQQ